MHLNISQNIRLELKKKPVERQTALIVIKKPNFFNESGTGTHRAQILLMKNKKSYKKIEKTKTKKREEKEQQRTYLHVVISIECFVAN